MPFFRVPCRLAAGPHARAPALRCAWLPPTHSMLEASTLGSCAPRAWSRPSRASQTCNEVSAWRQAALARQSTARQARPLRRRTDRALLRTAVARQQAPEALRKAPPRDPDIEGPSTDPAVIVERLQRVRPLGQGCTTTTLMGVTTIARPQGRCGLRHVISLCYYFSNTA